MPLSNLDILIKLKEQQLNDEKAAKAKRKKANQKGARIRRIESAIATRKATLIGETIRDAMKAGDLTPEELVVVGRILDRRKDKPEDWHCLAEFLPAPRVSFQRSPVTG